MALQKFSFKQISKYVEHSDNKSTLTVILKGAKSCYKKVLALCWFLHTKHKSFREGQSYEDETELLLICAHIQN